MFNSILAMLVSTGISLQPLPKVTATVDHTEKGLSDYAVVNVSVENQYGDNLYEFYIPQEDFNEYKNDGTDLSVKTAVGTFIGGHECVLPDGSTDIFYQFKSYDNKVWWAVTEKEIGFKPLLDTPYLIAEYENDTTECPKYEHECTGEEFVYDDIFLGAYEL